MKTLFHVTLKKNVPSIKKSGIRCGKKKMWGTALGGVLGKKDHIYSFTCFDDAARWAFKTQFETEKPAVVVEFTDDEALWEPDDHWESQMSKGKWLTRKGNIQSKQIVDIISLTLEICQALPKTLATDRQVHKTGDIR